MSSSIKKLEFAGEEALPCTNHGRSQLSPYPLPPAALTGVYSNPQFDGFVRQMAYRIVADGVEQMKRHRGDLTGVVVLVAYRQPADDHVGVANCFDLVDVVVADDGVEERVQVVEQVDDLKGSTLGRQSREADDVREVDRHALVLFRYHRLVTH